ncbi:1-pyrroline-5-carboxylate dehydrogenase [Coemansia sp. RSA 1807]|nr:1-pyrroline-5-carboxylate dehydrogenase [Coemansia sp. RSA 921]KAJ2149955.1 1-pyrroline-5-carboxylate dehydrogenase [Coemansia sp. RSA 637]KAJ2165092.1 1-pyrroline-5-carboxylate dehydrogenase [Coemansia sp. RSA 562]KAJ2186441.1 1-pyrroline-5-carboxylate dehydrogenase [Coemansia sp. RSA 532]KAJ2225749.1 1-pyrroline-5-carboxylate dehydrogenase [Coemansia sp. RSA 518]KAJ2258217.1 1-pyrroline-5-carboxylate dehydrogenase [Coemansia sp. RSA 454]KAJ2271928.1 1-pyrroline-5-carboxylate dehydrogenas
MLRLNRTCAIKAACTSLRSYSASPIVRSSGVRVPQLATFRLPEIKNEPTLDYVPGSLEQEQLMATVAEMSTKTYHVPLVINGREVRTGDVKEQLNPGKKSHVVCTYENAGAKEVEEAIEGTLAAKSKWEAMPIYDRQAIFLRTADLIATKYRYKLMAASMLGQGKNIWQAEIDAATESVDFLRFNAKYASEIYAQQPPCNAPGVWNRVEYRPLEGFVYAVSPFNFTAIGVNLAAAPALMGNTVLWKPSQGAVLSNYVAFDIMREAGVPDGVIQFVPGDAVSMTKQVFDHPEFASLHFTGSTSVFKHMWKQIAQNLDVYKSYPRIVGETGGKNYHLVHPSANLDSAVNNTIRGAFEFQGQKCSACSRLYVPRSLWPQFREKLVAGVESIKQGPVTNTTNFSGPVVNQAAFDKITNYIEYARNSNDSEIIAGGKYSDSEGYYIRPTVVATTNPDFKLLKEEIFGPVVTAYVYEDAQLDATIDLIGKTTPYALTGAIFAEDRHAAVELSARLLHTAGNFYINDKCTGAVVGQQPFGGSRASGTNDKPGSPSLLQRFISPRSIKENMIPISGFTYPSNQ